MQLYRRKQDTDAFMELIEENMQPMYKTAWAILRNEEDVADALQETIVKGFESLHTLRRPEFFNLIKQEFPHLQGMNKIK